MNASIEEIKDKLAPLFKDKELHIASVFGSTVSGEFKKQRGDIDLAFLFDKPVDVLALTDRIIGLLHFDDVDVIDLRRANPLLGFSAVKNGKLLYERSPGPFNEFFSLTFRRCVDTKKLRDAEAKAIEYYLEKKGIGVSPLETEIVRRKLAVIVDNLKALDPIKDMTQEEYIRELYKRKAAERLLQELIEAAIDINTYVIVQTGNAAPDDYYESFLKMGELKIISLDLAKKLAPSAGLRNRLVHEYSQLDHSMILDAVRMAEELYSRYIKERNDYVSKISRRNFLTEALWIASGPKN